jgi:hypothetical protein
MEQWQAYVESCRFADRFAVYNRQVQQLPPPVPFPSFHPFRLWPWC